MELYGVIGDIHLPFEDRRALDLALDIFEDQGITHLILNGDVLDFYCLNSYGAKHPDVQATLEDEFYAGQEFLNNLRKRFVDVKITYIFGNHEYRLDRFVMENCPGFWNLLKLEKQLNLKELGINWVPYNERYQLGKANIYCQHSPPSYSENAAVTSFKKKLDVDHIWNCTHRTDRSVKTGSSGTTYTSYINGWFGSKGIIEDLQAKMPDNRRVFSFTKNHEVWNRSFCLVYVDGPKYHVNQIIMKDYECMVGNTLYEG